MMFSNPIMEGAALRFCDFKILPSHLLNNKYPQNPTIIAFAPFEELKDFFSNPVIERLAKICIKRLMPDAVIAEFVLDV